MELGFKTKHTVKNSCARVGTLTTAHGVIQTPAFVPVGTQASVKGMTPDDLRGVGAECVLSNTYHLYLRPGPEVIGAMGGLHGFMNWDGPIFTDSGGFQVFSLGIAMEHEVGKVVDLFADDSREEVALNQKIEKAKERKELLDIRTFCKVDDEGSTFMSHLDGTLHRWTAEKSMQVQNLLGSDIVLALDECTSPLHEYEYTKHSMERSHEWERRSLVEFRKIQKEREARRQSKDQSIRQAQDKRAKIPPSLKLRRTSKIVESSMNFSKNNRHNFHSQMLYGIVQGGPFEDLRKESAQFVANAGFDGMAIGGALVSKRTMTEILDWVIPELPDDKPRHLLGIGEIDDIFIGVEAGIDTFDCAHPTRIARRGNVYISPQNGGAKANRWRIGIGHQEFKDDARPIDPGCDCYTCQNFSRSYLRHLYWARELTYFRLATMHNLRFIFRLMEQVRESTTEGTLPQLRKLWME